MSCWCKCEPNISFDMEFNREFYMDFEVNPVMELNTDLATEFDTEFKVERDTEFIMEPVIDIMHCLLGGNNKYLRRRKMNKSRSYSVLLIILLISILGDVPVSMYLFLMVMFIPSSVSRVSLVALPISTFPRTPCCCQSHYLCCR